MARTTREDHEICDPQDEWSDADLQLSPCQWHTFGTTMIPNPNRKSWQKIEKSSEKDGSKILQKSPRSVVPRTFGAKSGSNKEGTLTSTTFLAMGVAMGTRAPVVNPNECKFDQEILPLTIETSRNLEGAKDATGNIDPGFRKKSWKTHHQPEQSKSLPGLLQIRPVVHHAPLRREVRAVFGGKALAKLGMVA